jgi:hypothetical protein
VFFSQALWDKLTEAVGPEEDDCEATGEDSDDGHSKVQSGLSDSSSSDKNGAESGERESQDGSQRLEIGVEECEMLLEWMRRKQDKLQDSATRFLNFFCSCLVL